MKIILTILFIIIFWSIVVEPNIITVTEIQLEDKQLAGTKIVFASDLHIKPYEKYRLERIIKTINKQNADIVLLGGDYVNGHHKGNSLTIQEIASGLSQLHSKHGTFAVIGNHDGWQGKEEAIYELNKAGINVLLNENKKAGNVYIAGVDDLQTGKPDINKALEGIKQPTIFLTHSPDLFPNVPESVNLTLAGHLHGGQIKFPFIGALTMPSKYGKRYAEGLIEEDNKIMYVSRGLGTSILAMRFNCPPQIVIINFK